MFHSEILLDTGMANLVQVNSLKFLFVRELLCLGRGESESNLEYYRPLVTWILFEKENCYV